MSEDYPICECSNYYGTKTHHPECPVLRRIQELEKQVDAVANSIPWEWLEMANIKYGSEIFPDPYKGDDDG